MGAESQSQTGEPHALPDDPDPLDQQAVTACFALDYLPDEDHTIERPADYEFWRDYRVRDPKKVVDEIETLVRDHQVGFFILADEEPSINRKKFVEFCQELIDRGLPDKVKWGINTRVTDIYRDRDLLPFYRKAGLVFTQAQSEEFFGEAGRALAVLRQPLGQ